MASTTYSTRLPAFQWLHQHDEVGYQLDELIDSWCPRADTVAERTVAIGVAPDGQSAPVAADTPLRAH